MRPFIAILFGATVAAFAGFAGCSTESNSGNTTGANASVNVSVGSGQNTCHGNLPDGTCEIGANAEDCACQDCFLTAKCKNLCNDDGNCDYQPGTAEDCSCVDCLQTQGDCKADMNCDDNSDPDNGIPNTCTSADACTCSECADAPQCQACNKDGLCDAFTESCSCSDCSGVENCGGTSSSTTGPGGGGGMGGTGGAAASTSNSTVASTAASSAASTAAASTGAGGAGGN